MTSLGRQDSDLHHEDGTHRTTPASANGHVLDLHYGRMLRHLESHRQAKAETPVSAEFSD